MTTQAVSQFKSLTLQRSGIGYTSDMDMTEMPRAGSLLRVVTLVFFFCFLVSEFTTYSLEAGGSVSS
jgi:hypothetical protein